MRRKLILKSSNKQLILTKNFLVLLFFIGIGYSILETELTIDGNVELAKLDKTLYGVMRKEAQANRLAKTYTGSHQDSMDASLSTEEIYYWYADNNIEANSIQNKNNVIFANHCWQMIRTTDTGGVKLLYNGEPTSDGKCTTNRSEHIGYRYNMSTASIGDFLVTPTGSPPPYMTISSNFSYDASTNVYTLEGDKHNFVEDSLFHNSNQNIEGFTCGPGDDDSCTYMYYFSPSQEHYELISTSNYSQFGTVEFNEFSQAAHIGYMYGSDPDDYSNPENINDSIIKGAIDGWYSNYLKDYSAYIEDTIYCNDRSVSDAGDIVKFNNYENNTNLSCPNNVDKFSLNNNVAKLKYPIGLMTNSEKNLLGNNNVLASGENYWLMTPKYYDTSSYISSVSSEGELTSSISRSDDNGLRPVISLVPQTKYSAGDGSMNKPYIADIPAYEISISDSGYKIPTEGIKGQEVVIRTNNRQTKVTSFKLNGETIQGNKFTMPEADVTITDVVSASAVNYAQASILYEQTILSRPSVSTDGLTFQYEITPVGNTLPVNGSSGNKFVFSLTGTVYDEYMLIEVPYMASESASTNDYTRLDYKVKADSDITYETDVVPAEEQYDMSIYVNNKTGNVELVVFVYESTPFDGLSFRPQYTGESGDPTKPTDPSGPDTPTEPDEPVRP